MVDQLAQWDKDLFLYLNSLHTPWLDPVMFYISQTIVWVPLYMFLLFLILKDFRQHSWTIVIGIALTILLADQINTSFLKPHFERLRPSRDPVMEGLVHTINGYVGGKFGFASSHASNTMGAALFFWMLFGKRRRWVAILFFWSVVVSYSRIYLGVHYPGDILAGMLIGIGSACIGFYIHTLLAEKFKPKTSGSGTQ